MTTRLTLMAGAMAVGVMLSTSAGAQHTRLLPESPASDGTAEQVPRVPQSLLPETVDAFVAPLSESQARRLLIAELRDQAEERQSLQEEITRGGAVDLIQRLQATSMALSTTTAELFAALSALPSTGSYMFLNLTDGNGWPAMLRGLLVFALLVACGFGAQYYLGRKLRGVGTRLGQAASMVPAGASGRGDLAA